MNQNQTYIDMYCIFAPLVLTFLIMIFIYWKHYQKTDTYFNFITEKLSLNPIICIVIEIFVIIWILLGLVTNTLSEYGDPFVILRFNFSFWGVALSLDRFKKYWFGRYIILISIILLIWSILSLYGLDDNTWKIFLNLLKLF